MFGQVPLRQDVAVLGEDGAGVGAPSHRADAEEDNDTLKVVRHAGAGESDVAGAAAALRRPHVADDAVRCTIGQLRLHSLPALLQQTRQNAPLHRPRRRYLEVRVQLLPTHIPSLSSHTAENLVD